MLIHQALPVLAARFPSLARELRAVGSLLEGQPGGFLHLPAAVLAAALEAIAFGGHAAGSYHRRWAALEASVFLQYEHGGRPSSLDFSTAVGLWASAIARAGGGYRAHAANTEADAATGRPSQAPALAAVLGVLATDLAVITVAAEELRAGGRAATIKQVAAYVAHHPGMKGPMVMPPKPPPPDPALPRRGRGRPKKKRPEDVAADA